jgi:hypothetical protein
MFHTQHAIGQYTRVAQMKMKTIIGTSRPRSAIAPVTIAPVVAQNIICSFHQPPIPYNRRALYSLDRNYTTVPESVGFLDLVLQAYSSIRNVLGSQYIHLSQLKKKPASNPKDTIGM